jgi:hypothetical protein
MGLSVFTGKRLIEALTSKTAGNEAATILNNDVYGMPLAQVATSISTAWSGLMVGDLVIHIPATAGNSAFGTVATANTAPFALVVGDLYVVIRLATAAPVTNFL